MAGAEMSGVRAMRGQRGQAMTEFLVAAMFFLVPLFLGLAIMGKFVDVQHTADQASRYAAWERTVWYDEAPGSDFHKINEANHKSTAAINNEIAVRLLNDRKSADTVIKDTDKAATTFANGIDPLWRDNAGVAYLDSFDDMDTAGTRETPSKDFMGKIIGVIDKVNIAEFLTGSVMPPVPSDTLAVVKVSLNRVGENSEAYKRLWATPAWAGMDFESSGAILSNTWYANSSQGTLGMVKKTVPTAQGMKTIVHAVQAGMATWEPLKIKDIDVGRIRVDELPPDRLK